MAGGFAGATSFVAAGFVALVSVWDSAPCCQTRQPSSVAISIFDFIPFPPVWLWFILIMLNMGYKTCGSAMTFLAVVPFATSDERRKFRASKRLILKKICPGRLVGNECCRIYFLVSAVFRIVQLVTLSAGFNHHGTGLDFKAAYVNRALGSDKVFLVAHAKSVIIDNDQPMIGRAGNAF